VNNLSIRREPDAHLVVSHLYAVTYEHGAKRFSSLLPKICHALGLRFAIIS
jgi:hypothetical protein